MEPKPPHPSWHPLLPNQRQQCLAAKGNLTVAEVCAVIGFGRLVWQDWAAERRGIDPALLEGLRAGAKLKYPHYRSDLADPATIIWAIR